MYDVSDAELIYLYKQNNYDAFNILANRYKKKTYGLIEKVKHMSGEKYLDFDDLYHTCYIAFNKCIENFNDESIFYSYVMRAMENVIKRAVEKESRFSSLLSLEEYINVETYTLSDSIHEASCLYEENCLKEVINNECDETDNLIAMYKYSGYSNKEIEGIINISAKQIYNRIVRMKKVLKNAGYH